MVCYWLLAMPYVLSRFSGEAEVFHELEDDLEGVAVGGSVVGGSQNTRHYNIERPSERDRGLQG